MLIRADAMKVYAPSARLAPYVRSFEVVEACEEMTRALFPEPGIIVGFRYAGASDLMEGAAAHRVPNWVITGLRGTVRRMRTLPGSGILLVKFREMGAAAFFDVPLHELFGSALALEDLIPRAELERVASDLAQAPDDDARIASVERFLLARWKPREDDARVLAAVNALNAERGVLRIADLARRLHLSQDALEKRFRRIVGASPKRFASMLRLRHAMQRYRPGASLSELALDAGYYDQSHFIREFKAATGEAPQRFLRLGNDG